MKLHAATLVLSAVLVTGALANDVTSEITVESIANNLSSKEVVLTKPRLKFSGPYMDGYHTFGFYNSQENGDRICAKFGFGSMTGHSKSDPRYRAYIKEDGSVEVKKHNPGYIFDTYITCQKSETSEFKPVTIGDNTITPLSAIISNEGIVRADAADEIIIKTPRLKFSAKYIGGYDTYLFKDDQADNICALFGFGKSLSIDKSDPGYRAYVTKEGVVSVKKHNPNYAINRYVSCQANSALDTKLSALQTLLKEQKQLEVGVLKLKTLKSLDLSTIDLKNVDLSFFEELTQLEELNLSMTGINNSVLAKLKPLQKLKVLNLSNNSKVTSAKTYRPQLLTLNELDSLKVLVLKGTRVSKTVDIIAFLKGKGIKIIQ